MEEQLHMMEVKCRAQSEADAPNVKMGDPHNQDVVKVVFVKYNITSIIEIKRSVAIEVVN